MSLSPIVKGHMEKLILAVDITHDLKLEISSIHQVLWVFLGLGLKQHSNLYMGSFAWMVTMLFARDHITCIHNASLT